MTSLLTNPQSFVAGELSARMAGRVDDAKYAHGARRLENVVVEPSGCARKRPGTDLVHETRNHDKESTLFTFGLPGGGTLWIEVGFRQEFPGSSTIPMYARFHSQGGTELHSTAWNSTTTYAVGDFVRDAGKLYRCVTANLNSQPPNANWFPLEWFDDKTCAPGDVDTGNNWITFGSPHSFTTGDPVELTNDTAAATPIRYDPDSDFVTGFVIVLSSTRIQLALTAGGPALNLINAGTGTHRFHRSYVRGDLVSSGGNIWFCRQTRPIVGTDPELSVNPGADENYWYPEPPGHEFEIPSPVGGAGFTALTEQQLLEMTSSQEGNTICFGHASNAPTEIVRTAAHTAFWRFSGITPTLSAPQGVDAVATKRGLTIKVRQIVQSGLGPQPPTRTMVRCQAEHQLAEGIDHVLIEGTGYPGADDKHWAIERGSDDTEFQPIDPDTGIPLVFTSTGGPYTVGTVRPVKLNAENNNSYKVTALDADGRESLPSAADSVLNNLFTPGAYNTITWQAVTGAIKYNIYKQALGNTALYGLLGTSEVLTFKDDGSVAPSLDRTPPIQDTTFGSGTGNFPRAVCHYEGRKGYGGTDNLSQDVWLSRTNTNGDFTYGIPVQATHRIHQRLKSRVACTVRHMVPLGKLVALTDRCEFRIGAIDTEALTPDSFAARSDSYVGVSTVQPVVLHNQILFACARGGHIYQMGWSGEAAAYLVNDLCERAQHLFDGFVPRHMGAGLQPVPIAWVAMEDGRLLGLTTVPTQQVYAWHQHSTDGQVRAVAAGPDGDDDHVYMIVRRTINGATKRFVERVSHFSLQAWDDSAYSDCAVIYAGTPISVVTGLSHLEAKTVTVFADGKVQTRKKVTDGQITLDKPASKVRVGLPYKVKVQTMPAAFAVAAYGSGKPKSVSVVWTRVEASGIFKIGPDETNLRPPHKIVADEPFSGLVDVRVDNNWAYDGSVFIEQDDPVPLTLVAMHAEMAVGG